MEVASSTLWSQLKKSEFFLWEATSTEADADANSDAVVIVVATGLKTCHVPTLKTELS